MSDSERTWASFPYGIDNGITSLTFARKEWDLGSERFIGMPFPKLVPILIRESRFHPNMFISPEWIGRHHGGVISAHFKIYKPVSHETQGSVRPTGASEDDRWSVLEVGPDGNFIGYNPLEDPTLRDEGYALALGSRVGLSIIFRYLAVLAGGHIGQ